MVSVEKVCSECHQSLPSDVEHFHQNKSKADGFQGICKPCVADYDRTYRAKNAERIKARRAVYQEAHRAEINADNNARRVRVFFTNPDKKREYDANYRQQNRDRVRGWQAKYADAHPERIAEGRRRYIAAHPDRNARKILAQNYRLRGPRMTEEDLDYAMILKGDPCCYCGKRVSTVDIDHIIPTTSGGSTHWFNLTAACPSCNRTKNNSTLLTYLLKRMKSHGG